MTFYRFGYIHIGYIRIRERSYWNKPSIGDSLTCIYKDLIDSIYLLAVLIEDMANVCIKAQS